MEHIHYRSWEDMNIPNKPGAVEALADIASRDGADFLINQFSNLQSGDLNPQKLAIHCRAGIGRTGTLLALINSFICLKEQGEDPKLSTFSIVRRLREQRFDMCETKNQYKFINDTMAQWYKKEMETIPEAQENEEN